MMVRQQQLAKAPSNYENLAVDQKETFEFEQKPIKNFNEFSNAEEAKLKKKQEFNLPRRENEQKKNELKNES